VYALKNRCVGYCNHLKAKLYESIPELKKCVCGAYLIPYKDIYLHPDTDCKYSSMIEVKITIHSDDYEKTLGNPKQTYQELIEHLTTMPKSLWDKFKDWWDGK